MAAYKKQDDKYRAAVEAGAMPEDEYTAWRRTQMLNNTRYTKAVENMTDTLVNTDVAAMAMVNGELPRVLAESFDFTTALGSAAAKKAGLEAATFQIYNQETVQALVKDKPNLFPKPSQKTIKELGGTVDIPEDKKWNKDRITRELTQGIVQGENINKIADRLQRVTNMDKNAAIRNARTAYTSAENLGRTAAAEDLKEQGIPIEEVWSATYDKRTRDTHLMLDGTKRDASGYFGVGLLNVPLRYPADPDGEPEEVYNCRCRLNIELAGIDHSKDDDLYDKFMRENYPDDYDALKENEPYQARQQEAEATKDRQTELRSQHPELTTTAPTTQPEEPKIYSPADKAKMEETAGQWEKGLSDRQKEAIHDYTNSGYGAMNRYLRTDDQDLKDSLSEKHPKWIGEIKEIDKAIDDYELKQDITVYRMAESDVLDQLNAGDVFHDGGYTSTTITEEVTDDMDGNVFIEIDVPAGKGRGAYIDNLSEYEGEDEFLMARGGDYEIVEKRELEDGMQYLHIKWIGKSE